ncbi:hypothetical protein EOI87_09910 [Salmonella enterica]|nr:hypothetical protein [Salmonella enterica]EDW4372074.1 hypothetical protein [Salmonella enterica subsp. diarizonae]
MSLKTSLCFICGATCKLNPDIQQGNIFWYKCRSCGDYYVSDTLSKKTGEGSFADYLSFKSSSPENEGKRMYIKYEGNDVINITFVRQDRF